MKIYKIIKPGTNEVYIGQTKLELKLRLQLHFSNKKHHSDRIIYQWLDENCTIELLEEFEGEKDIVKEMTYVKQYEYEGYIIMNMNTGKYILDTENYLKNKSDRLHSKYKANGKQYEWSKIMINKRHPEYGKWQTKICRAAKKEGLSSKEYRLKYSIPDYDGPKFKDYDHSS